MCNVVYNISIFFIGVIILGGGYMKKLKLRHLIFISCALLLTSCENALKIYENSDSEKSYSVNFEGTTAYGTIDSPWTPTSPNWEVEVVLAWDSSSGVNTYPIATNSAVTSIYVDTGGLALFKYEGTYITGNNNRLQDNELATIKYSITATQVRCYFNGVLENTVATSQSLSVPWSVVGAHSSYSGKFKGLIRKITFTDLADSSNTKVIDILLKTKDVNTLNSTILRDTTGVDFTLDSNAAFKKI